VATLLDENLGSLLNDAAETVGGSEDFFDGVAHFAKKNKSDEEKAQIDEKSEDFKAVGKIAKGGLKGLTLLLGFAVAVKYLLKK
jgi:hypothetical protein